MQSESSYSIIIQSKLAFFMSVLGYCSIALIPFNGLIPGFFLIGYSFYLCSKVKSRSPTNFLISMASFLNLAAIAFIIAITMMYFSIV